MIVNKMTYYVIGEWWIEEHDKTAWIYKNDTCYVRIPLTHYVREHELRGILEKFIILMGELYK